MISSTTNLIRLSVIIWEPWMTRSLTTWKSRSHWHVSRRLRFGKSRRSREEKMARERKKREREKEREGKEGRSGCWCDDDRDQRESRLTAIALEADAAVGAGNIVQQLLGVLADERLLVVARDVVPGDAVVVDVVQDGHAGLVGAVDVELGVVRLSDLLVAGLGPRVEGPAIRRLVRRRHLLAIRRPEPAVQGLGLEVTSVLAALEVAETPGRPDVRHVVCGNREIPRETCRLQRYNGVFVWKNFTRRQERAFQGKKWFLMTPSRPTCLQNRDVLWSWTLYYLRRLVWFVCPIDASFLFPNRNVGSWVSVLDAQSIRIEVEVA